MKFRSLLLATTPFLLVSCNHEVAPQSAPLSAQNDSKSKPKSELVDLPQNIPQTDVLVIGGTPSGVAAAIAAAREGSRVLLVEPRTRLGGDIVYALLNMFDVPMNSDGSSRMAVGIFGGWFKQLGIAFDVDDAELLGPVSKKMLF